MDEIDKRINKMADEKLTKLVEKLKQNNFEAEIVPNKETAKKRMLEIIPKWSKVSYGGSVTITSTGIKEELKKGDYKFIDWTNVEGKEKEKLLLESLYSDYYLASSNAITMDGHLVNIDGRGNRVAAFCYGPKKVIMVIGKNKITEDEVTGIARIKAVAAPLNAKKLGKNTPCAKTGKCANCKSEDRICRTITINQSQYKNSNRIHIILVDEELGF